jgi:hypothetical protein
MIRISILHVPCIRAYNLMIMDFLLDERFYRWPMTKWTIENMVHLVRNFSCTVIWIFFNRKMLYNKEALGSIPDKIVFEMVKTDDSKGFSLILIKQNCNMCHYSDKNLHCLHKNIIKSIQFFLDLVHDTTLSFQMRQNCRLSTFFSVDSNEKLIIT